MTLFDYKMDTFEEVNQILYFTLFDRGCIVINDFNKQVEAVLQKLKEKENEEKNTRDTRKRSRLTADLLLESGFNELMDDSLIEKKSPG